MGTTISGGFTSTVSTTVNEILVDNGGTLVVAAGGTVDVTFVLSGGSARFEAGGVGNNLTVSGGADATVSSGGAVNGAVVAGLLTVSARGDMTAAAVLPRGTVLVSSGGSATGGTIEGGSEYVLTGGLAIDTIVTSGALRVSFGGIARNTSALAGGSAVILAGGTEQVTAFGSAVGVTVQAGGTLTVGSQGVASGTIVMSGAAIGVDSGGTLYGTQIGSGGSVIVANGGTDSGNIVNVSGSETVLAGGSAISSIIGAALTPLSGAVLTISSGGVAIGTVLTEGALTIDSGGVAIDPLNEMSGSIMVSSGGLLSQTTSLSPLAGVTLDAGGTVALALGGVVAHVVVESGAVLSLGQSEGAISGVVSSGGTVLVGSSGVESGLVIMPGGNETVQSGGQTLGALLGGAMMVSSGGNALGTQVQFGALLTVANGGTAIDTNGVGIVVGNNVPFSGGATVISAGGTEIDAINAAGVTLAAGGRMTIAPGNGYNSAVATGTDILSGGDLVVSNGGTAGLTTLNAGGTMDLLSGAGAALVEIVGGSLTVGAGAFVAGPLIQNGGTLNILAGALGAFVGVDAGGIAQVYSGGAVSAAGVSGGILLLDAGAITLGGLAYAGYGGIIDFVGPQLPTVPLTGFGPDDSLLLQGIAFDPNYAIASANNVLSLSENGQTYTFNLVSANLGGEVINVTSAAGLGGTLIQVACFAAGTRIDTPAGAVSVEALRAGDTVLALVDGIWAPRPVRWVGHTTVDLARHPHPDKAAPVRVRANAVAPGAPARDLLLSPDHAVFLDGVLMQAQALSNGATVVQEFPERITYYHVELDRHAILSADGLAVESYLDTGNRALFAGEVGTRPLHPDLIAATWTENGCAPLVLSGPAMAEARARLLARALDLGFQVVSDPALRIVADGAGIACQRRGGTWRATLPAGTRAARIVSRQFVPRWFDADDRRRLGIAVRAPRIDDRAVSPCAYGAGWHAPEQEWQWTDGDATLMLLATYRPTRLSFMLVDAGARYWTLPAIAAPTPARRRATPSRR